MVESNHDEERVTRIEQMVERLRRDADRDHIPVTMAMVMAVAVLMPSSVPEPRIRARLD